MPAEPTAEEYRQMANSLLKDYRDSDGAEAITVQQRAFMLQEAQVCALLAESRGREDWANAMSGLISSISPAVNNIVSTVDAQFAAGSMIGALPRIAAILESNFGVHQLGLLPSPMSPVQQLLNWLSRNGVQLPTYGPVSQQ